MTRELHVHDHYSSLILFVSPDGAVEAYDINGFTSMGQFGSVAEAAACACADAANRGGTADPSGLGHPLPLAVLNHPRS